MSELNFPSGSGRHVAAGGAATYANQEAPHQRNRCGSVSGRWWGQARVCDCTAALSCAVAALRQLTQLRLPRSTVH